MTFQFVLIACVLAGLYLHEQQSRRQLALHVEKLHQEWIATVIKDPALRAAWVPFGSTLTDEECATVLHANQMISILCAEYHLGRLDTYQLRSEARWLMESDVGCTYWRAFGGFRESQAFGGKDRAINRILNDEYVAAASEDEVTA